MPLVSIVTPTRDRAERLRRLLSALDRQTVKAFEHVVVDDGSTDETARMPVVHQPPTGIAAARNRGWHLATADRVVFLDDDVEPEPGWLEALLNAADRHPGVILQGQVQPNPAETARAPFDRSLRIDGVTPHFETANILYPRPLLVQLGGFDERLTIAGEDTDLGQRALAAGAKVVYVPEALVYHAVHRKTARQTLKDATRATDCVRAYRDYPRLREHLQDGMWFHPSHPLLAQAAAAAVLTPVAPVLSVFAIPYGVHLARRCRANKAPLWAAGFYAARDTVETAATVRGAIRHRTLVL